jgi:hypothetical protein
LSDLDEIHHKDTKDTKKQKTNRGMSDIEASIGDAYQNAMTALQGF